jgi:hypothetical protein
MTRISGQDYLSGITIRVSDTYDFARAQAEVTSILSERHGTTDFYTQNSNTIRDTTLNGQAYTLKGGTLSPTPAYGTGRASGGFPDGTNARRAQVSARFVF